MKPAAIAYAKLDTSKPIMVRVRGRYVPIVVVPGFMGTRLTDPVTKKLVWNPTGFPMSLLTDATPGPFACNFERLQQVSSDLVPDDLFPNESEAEREAVKHIKYFDHMVTPYYGKLAKALAEAEYLSGSNDAGKLGVKPRVYCCGYDWRQDNAKSALRLAEVVDEALRETGEDKCLLVVHSMGGLVARHFCRALGGESKVFAIFSVGSPMLGAPSAYTQLKHGAPGMYVREYIHHEEDDDPDATTVDNVVTEAGSVMTGLATIGAAGVSEGLTGILGPVYLVLTLGAGKLLTRKESIYFARQIQSAYQLLPSSLFCDTHRNWVFFDPLNTGHPPSGYLIKFPTLLDAAVVAFAGQPNQFEEPAARAGDSLATQADRFLHGDGSARSNVLLEGANSETIEECLAGIGALIGTATSGGDLEDPMISRAVARILTLIDRATKSFLDCRNSRALYDDIFTGLLDAVSMRAISAYNLELSYRFDDSITVQPRETEIFSGLDLVLGLLSGVGSAFASLRPETDPQRLAESRTRAEREARDAERARPRAYIHPKTIAYATKDIPVDGGSVLLCMDLRSTYDANIVKYQLLPNLLGLMMGVPGSSGAPSAIYYGDGTVPYFSARPPDELLSHPLMSQSQDFTGITHTALTADQTVIDAIKGHIVELVPDWHRA